MADEAAEWLTRWAIHRVARIVSGHIEAAEARELPEEMIARLYDAQNRIDAVLAHSRQFVANQHHERGYLIDVKAFDALVQALEALDKPKGPPMTQIDTPKEPTDAH